MFEEKTQTKKRALGYIRYNRPPKDETALSMDFLNFLNAYRKYTNYTSELTSKNSKPKILNGYRLS